MPELAALMLNARLIVANDCGPSHIGQGVCVPYVGVFNEANPEWFWARSYTEAVYPEPGRVGIQLVSPGQVAAACSRVLQTPRPLWLSAQESPTEGQTGALKSGSMLRDRVAA